jgi:hypothetical protein
MPSAREACIIRVAAVRSLRQLPSRARALPAVLLLSVFLTQAAAAQTFDSRPLRSAAAFPAYPFPTEALPLMAWLKAQAGSLPQEGVVAAREQLFAIISADAKRRVRSGAPAFPRGADTVMAQLYEWSHRLGHPGSRLVAQRLGFSPGAGDPTSIETPGFDIAFDSLYTVVAEADGWTVRFPHYFMIGTATRQTPRNGKETSVLMLSTLFAKDSSTRPGASQATIIILSARATAPEMTAFWLEQLGMSPSDTAAKLSPSAVRTYRGRDNDARMTKELVVFAPPGRAILAAYIGLDGTFETNHPHFLDLLRTLRVR